MEISREAKLWKVSSVGGASRERGVEPVLSLVPRAGCFAPGTVGNLFLWLCCYGNINNRARQGRKPKLKLLSLVHWQSKTESGMALNRLQKEKILCSKMEVHLACDTPAELPVIPECRKYIRITR